MVCCDISTSPRSTPSNSDYHVKSDLVKASYSSLWLEMGGEKQARGWYKLPAQEIKKSIEEVKSKHRSQFIKREGLKELIQINMANALPTNYLACAGELTPLTRQAGGWGLLPGWRFPLSPGRCAVGYCPLSPTGGDAETVSSGALRHHTIRATIAITLSTPKAVA